MHLDQIIDEYGEAIFRAAFQVLHNAHDAEDVTQEVLLEALRMPSIPAPALLRRMAALRAIDSLRRRRSLPLVDLESGADTSPRPEQIHEQSEQIQRMQRAIRQLPPRQARCFWLRYVECLSNQEIAESLGISCSAVSTAIGKAKQNLRASFTFIATESK